jgi:hypothetical protein
MLKNKIKLNYGFPILNLRNNNEKRTEQPYVINNVTIRCKLLVKC